MTDTACAKCWHFHPYTDEECVSCGCDWTYVAAEYARLSKMNHYEPFRPEARAEDG